MHVISDVLEELYRRSFTPIEDLPDRFDAGTSGCMRCCVPRGLRPPRPAVARGAGRGPRQHRRGGALDGAAGPPDRRPGRTVGALPEEREHAGLRHRRRPAAALASMLEWFALTGAVFGQVAGLPGQAPRSPPRVMHRPRSIPPSSTPSPTSGPGRSSPSGDPAHGPGHGRLSTPVTMPTPPQTIDRRRTPAVSLLWWVTGPLLLALVATIVVAARPVPYLTISPGSARAVEPLITFIAPDGWSGPPPSSGRRGLLFVTGLVRRPAGIEALWFAVTTPPTSCPRTWSPAGQSRADKPRLQPGPHDQLQGQGRQGGAGPVRATR